MLTDAQREEIWDVADNVLTWGGDRRHMEAPVPCPVLEEVDAHPLFEWGIFNPFGCTLTSFWLLDLPEHHDQLVCVHIDTALGTHDLAFRILPTGHPTADLLGCLNELIDANGWSDNRLHESLPTMVLHRDNVPGASKSPLPRLGAREVGGLMLTLARSKDAQEVRDAIDALRAHPTDPWERASYELDQALGRDEHDDDDEHEDDDFDDDLPSPLELEVWLTYVTEAEHVAVEAVEIYALLEQGGIR